MQGDGLINFNSNDAGRNGGYFLQDMTNGTVNLMGAYLDPGVAQASYELRNGTLNFASATSANFLSGPGATRYFKLPEARWTIPAGAT